MLKNRKILGRSGEWGGVVFSGVLETGDPRISHVNSVSAGEAGSWGPTLTGETLCPRSETLC